MYTLLGKQKVIIERLFAWNRGEVTFWDALSWQQTSGDIRVFRRAGCVKFLAVLILQNHGEGADNWRMWEKCSGAHWSCAGYGWEVYYSGEMCCTSDREFQGGGGTKDHFELLLVWFKSRPWAEMCSQASDMMAFPAWNQLGSCHFA